MRGGSSSSRPNRVGNSQPFIPQDVFRLVVRLEAQKALGGVDLDALECKFRVPFGYSDEHTQRKQERMELNVRTNAWMRYRETGLFPLTNCAAFQNLPGPGAYEVDDPWKDSTHAHPSAIFASRTERDPLQRLPPARNAVSLSPAAMSPSHTASNSNHSPTRIADSRPSLGSFSRTERGLGAENSASYSHASSQDSRNEGSTLSSQSAVFPRVSREKESFGPSSDPGLGPGSYDVRRLWDSDRGNVVAENPSSSAFGASREKRVVMWSPARNPPSCAIPESWNASPHYAKQKAKVLHATERKKKLAMKQQKKSLENSKSTPGLSSLKHSSKSSNNSEDFDPFKWLRRQPHGEQRTTLLAAKYGLLDQMKVHSHPHPSHSPVTEKAPGDDADNTTDRNGGGTDATDAKAVLHRQSSWLEGKAVAHDDGSVLRQKDERIVVSCRLPGGMMLSTQIFSRKKIRHLKAFIVHNQKRYTHEEQFDLYLPNGKKLGQLEDALASCGIANRSLVQIVPTSTV